jgi:hypothetical protein
MALLCNSNSLIRIDPRRGKKNVCLCGESVKTNLIFKESIVYVNHPVTVSQFMCCFRPFLGDLSPVLARDNPKNTPKATEIRPDVRNPG